MPAGNCFYHSQNNEFNRVTNMQNASSYTVPKLVLANVLAMMMMLFEQHAPADAPQKTQSMVNDKTGQQQNATGTAQPETAQTASAPKKRLYKVRHSTKSSRPQMIHAKGAAGPVDCCFRGYKS